MSVTKPEDWIRFNTAAHTYDTKDGTSVPAELIENADCLADVLHVADIRAKQRAAIKATGQEGGK